MTWWVANVKQPRQAGGVVGDLELHPLEELRKVIGVAVARHRQDDA